MLRTAENLFSFSSICMLSVRVNLDFTSLTSFHPEFLQVLFIFYLKCTVCLKEIAFVMGGALMLF